MDKRSLKERVKDDPTYQKALEAAPEEDRDNIEATVMHVMEHFEEVNRFLRGVLEDPEKAQKMKDLIIEMASKQR